MTLIDPKSFRFALGNFATGVTIVTTLDGAGNEIGVTASSFNSVSLDPPMVLWSLDRKSYSLAGFEQAEHFIVNVLSADQVELSNRFARAGDDKFAGLEFERGVGDIPMFGGCSARFQCRTAHQYAGGDHVIFVGEVLDFDVTGRTGLVFHQGRYSVSAEHPVVNRPAETCNGSGFVKNFVPYLTGICHQQFLSGFQQTVASGHLEDHHYRVLFTLKDLQSADLESIAELTLLCDELVELTLADLASRGLAIRQGETYQPSPSGLEALGCIEEQVVAAETRMLSALSASESQQFKRQLARLIEWNSEQAAA